MKSLFAITILFYFLGHSFAASNKIYSEKELLKLYLDEGGTKESFYLEEGSDYEDKESYYNDPIGIDCDDCPGEEKSNVEKATDQIRKIASKIPSKSLRDGLNTYLDIIGAENYGDVASVGTGNAGISAHYENVISRNNSCFSKMAKEFFDEIRELDSSSDYDKKKRPSLTTKSGEGKFKKLEPGWLWKRALQKTGGNANLAIRMIGLCGHDDILQGEYTYNVSIADQSSKKKYMDDNLTLNIGLHMDQDEKQEEIKRYFNEKRRIENSASATELVDCPIQTSQYYLSDALGDGVSIDQKMKSRIVSTQGKDASPKNIASKNYHIMGAAYMTCRLVEDGIHPRLAEQIQVSAAWAYRTLRMHSAIDVDMIRRSNFQKAYKSYADGIKRPLSESDFLWDYATKSHYKKGDCSSDTYIEVGGKKLPCDKGRVRYHDGPR